VAEAHGSPVKNPYFTVGHSTRSIDEFVGMIKSPGVTFVVDVRTVPRSRTNPQYNRDVLRESLAAFQIGYEHSAALGGLRGRNRNVPPDVNAFWRNESFHNYADYAMGSDFRAGLDRLTEHARDQRCVIMCAEVLWWRCHRRIIADYLLAAGEDVFHLMGPGQVQPARITDSACRAASGVLTYPATRPTEGPAHPPRGRE
jgi:uncharacterized protein (DUF488 family)